MRVGDVLGPEFRAVYDRVKARHEATLRSLGYVYDIAELERQWFDAVEYLKEFRLIDSEYEINRLLAEGSSLKEVADVLRHRSLNTTMIYAKLDSRKLIEVALPWPGSKP